MTNTNGPMSGAKEGGHPPLPASRLTNNSRVAKTKDLQATSNGVALLDRDAWGQGFRAVHDLLAERLDEKLTDKATHQLKGLETRVTDRLEAVETEITGRLMREMEKRLQEAISIQVRKMVDAQVAPLIAEATATLNQAFDERFAELRQLDAQLTTVRDEIERSIDGLHEAKSLLENITIQTVIPPESLRVDVDIKQLPSVVNVEVPSQKPIKKTIVYDEYHRPQTILEEPGE